MGFSYFRLKSANGKIFSLNNLKELKKSDLGDDAALIRLFNLFDYQNKDGKEGSDGVLNKEELKSLFDFMSYGAKIKGNASIFEQVEAQEFVSKSTVNGKTFKELGIKAADLFNFLSSLILPDEENSTNVSGTEAIRKSYTPEEIEEISVQTITDNVKKARQLFNSQKENQGAVSDFVNGTKEAFDTEYAVSRVNRYIMREELCANLLEKSNSEAGLSEKEYLEAKIDLAARMLPELKSTSLRNIIIQNISLFGVAYKAFNRKSKAEQELIKLEIEVELLKEALRRLTPEELTSFIQDIVSASDEDYANEAGKFAEQMIKSSLDYRLLNNQGQKAPLESRGGIGYKYKAAPGSIESIEQQSAKYRKMTFEETFEAERGVAYNADLVMDYAQKDAQMQFILGVHNKRQQIYDILHNPIVALDSEIQFGRIGSGTKILDNNLHRAIITVLMELYGDDIEKMQAGLDKLEIKGLKIVNGANGLNSLRLIYANEDVDNSDLLANKTELNEYDLVNVAKKLQGMVDTNYQNVLAGKTLEEYSDEVKSAYQIAYGDRNSGDIADAFVQSQQEGVQTVRTVTQTGAMLMMVAGQLIPVGGQASAVMIYGGLLTSAVSGTAISAIENCTKAGGFTEEDKKEMLKELVTSIALVASGVGIGKTSEAAFRALVIKNCPKLLAWASEIGIDATMGIVADYAITGQIDLSGEGIAQLQAVLVGILHAKGNFRTYLNTHAGNIKPKADDTSVRMEDHYMSRCQSQYIEQVSNSKSSHIIDNLKVEKVAADDGSTIYIVTETNKSGKVVGQKKYSVIGDEIREVVELKRKSIDDLPPEEQRVGRSAMQTHEKYSETMQKCRENSEQANMLYKKYLDEQDASPEVKEYCQKISDEFGLKIFFCDDLDGTRENLAKIYNTLSDLAKRAEAHGEKLKTPSTIEPYSIQDILTNKGGEADIQNNRILLRSLSKDDALELFIHELVHFNDKKNLRKYPDNFNKQWAANELKKSGVDEHYINYALNSNPGELLAVAMQKGNYSSYSPEFKQVLIDFGLPAYMLDTKPVGTNVKSANDVGSQKTDKVRQSEIKFNELKQIIQELSNPDELNRLSVEINNPDGNLSYKQRQALVDMASDKIEEFVQKGEIDPTEIDLHYNALTSWAKAGAGMPEIVSECYSGESVKKMAAYLAKKTSNPDLYYDAIGKITEKILTGEVPSKTMLDELVVQIKKQVGGPTSDIRNILLGALNKIDEMKCFVNAGYFDSKSISSSSPGYRRNIERFKSSLKNKTDVGAEKKSSEKVEQKTESKVESKSNNTNETPELFSESEQKIIRQSATDTNFEILQNAINEIIELMKAGKIPDLEFIEALATKYRVRPSDLKSDLIYALKKLGSINKNYFDLRNACVTSNKNELPAATIDGLNNFMREKNIKFNDGVEKIKSPQKESVEPVKTYDIRESAEYKQYSEKYPELKEIPFRDDNSLIKAGKAMEKYEHYLKDNEITYENFDETDLYQRLSDIENGTDAEDVVNVMKNKYHSDVVAEQKRIANLKSKYLLDDEQIKISDKIISKIKKMQANEEPYTVDDINTMIEDAQGYNDIMNERVRKRILDEIKI